MKNSVLALYLLVYPIACLFCQPKYHIEHYGLADGLSQRSIMSIIQDKKGFMWFATWDGLCKFDGYNFTTYKSSQGDSIFMRSNRIDKIHEDIFGYIWVHSYGHETFRFDPKKEKYIASFQSKENPFSTSQIITMPSGRVWLTSENMGAICSPRPTGKPVRFNIGNNKLKSNFIYTVYEDSMQNSWILTQNGIAKTDKNFDTKIFLSDDGNRPFFSVFETEKDIWFGSEKGRIYCYNKNDNRFFILDTGTQSDIISIKKIYDNLLVILTSEDGFMICDVEKNILKRFNKETNKDLPTNKMVSCFIDKNNNIWLEMNYPGIAKYNIVKNQLIHYKLDNPKKFMDQFGPHFFIVEDKAGSIWIHPKGGGFYYYDKASDLLMPFYNSQNPFEVRFSDRLHDIFLDKQGNLWLSSRSSGIEKIVFDNEMFKSDSFKPQAQSSDENEIRAVFEDKNKNIWLGSKEGVVMVYDEKKRYTGHLCSNGNISKTEKPLNISAYTFCQDDDDKIWIGTKGNGVFILTPSDKSYKITQHKNNPSDINSLSDDKIYSIHIDKRKQIWIGTYGGGLNLFDKKNNCFINFRNRLSTYPIETGSQIRSVNSFKDKIYVGTTLGLIVFSPTIEKPDKIGYNIYSKAYNEKNGLRANDIYNIFVTGNEEVFIATFGGGLSKVTGFDDNGLPSGFKTYDMKNGLPSDIVLSIIEDNSNNIWINSEGRLSRFNPANETLEQFNEINRILNKNFFSEALPLLSSDGEIIMGTTNGTLSFLPESIARNGYSPYLAFIKFNVSNKDYPLNEPIDEVNSIKLSHDENIFSIEFAALDFTNPEGISYAYKLEGIDKDWINNYNQRIVNYTKLPPGDYTFKVKSTNSDGTWAGNERSLSITIKPAFWQTSWAYIIYVIVLAMILYIILRSIFVFYRMRDKVQMEQEQTEMKTRFFTDISHEIRTPLTMIVSPIENLLNEKEIPDKAKSQLQLILKNTNRMLNMVNQILDFRKIQKQKLQVKEIVLGDFVSNLCNNLITTVKEQGIILEINHQTAGEKIWADEDGIEKLVFNLVSNSIKHTGTNKKVEVNVFKKDKSTIALQVKDEGTGMNKEILNKLFIRFASFNTDKNKPSSGIGLSIVKEVVDKHHAKITVDSEIDKGSTFTILFQTGLNHFLNDNNIEIIPSDHQNKTNNVQPADTANNIFPASNNKLSILVAEDDPDLRGFIKSVLDTDYAVIEAENGKDGYEKIIKHMPDFILSDIMMPETDGIELLKKIRKNHETSHIPVILLTAKTNIDDTIEGITTGADDYITKPFNIKLLKAKINNILRQRRKVLEYIAENKSLGIPFDGESNVTSKDELFLKELRKNIIDNLDNSDLSIDDLVSRTNLSRRVFFNKVKSLTGLAPIEFVRETKIRKAAELLRIPQYRIKEITYMIGFSDSKYFTQCFKNIYGVTPTEYRNQFKD